MSKLELNNSERLTVVQGDLTVKFGPKGLKINGITYTPPPQTVANDRVESAAILDHPTLNIGDKVFNENGACTGIYQGFEARTNAQGLTETWDLYAAPTDLTDEHENTLVTTYNNAVAALNAKKDWHGYDGECFESSGDLDAAFANGTYKGGWFIGDEGQVKRQYDNKDKMPDGTGFVEEYGSGFAHWYWSSTEHPDDSSLVYNVDFTDGDDDWGHKVDCELSTRPVRAERRNDVSHLTL